MSDPSLISPAIFAHGVDSILPKGPVLGGPPRDEIAGELVYEIPNIGRDSEYWYF